MILDGDISPIDEILYKTADGFRQFRNRIVWLVVFGRIGNLEAILIYLQRPNFGFKG